MIRRERRFGSAKRSFGPLAVRSANVSSRALGECCDYFPRANACRLRRLSRRPRRQSQLDPSRATKSTQKPMRRESVVTLRVPRIAPRDEWRCSETTSSHRRAELPPPPSRESAVCPNSTRTAPTRHLAAGLAPQEPPRSGFHFFNLPDCIILAGQVGQ